MLFFWFQPKEQDLIPLSRLLSGRAEVRRFLYLFLFHFPVCSIMLAAYALQQTLVAATNHNHIPHSRQLFQTGAPGK
jgi:hypothetical protein